MDLSKLESFAVDARRELMRSVSEKIDYAMQEGNALARLYPQAVARLLETVKKQGKDAVVEKTAYTWFNRFCALRFMDVNGYTDAGVVTPPMGGTIPGILAEARDGNFDDSLFGSGVKDRVRNILSGAMREDDPNAAAYRTLFVATCNAWNAKMPFLFEKLGDESEVLLPDDLLSSASILAKVRAALTPQICSDVEVIGWLYQFYISEKKSGVLDRLSRKAKVLDSDVPAATALFTPDWIVRYMVDNSLGRWWMRSHPDSPLIEKMSYFIPDDPSASPVDRLPSTDDITNLKVCDTSCGSGHILVYAFDLLYSMYEELGYAPTEIPSNILKNNLYGYEIDERSAALASFALVMKARQRYSRFLRNPVLPKITCFRNISFTLEEQHSTVYKRFVDSATNSALEIGRDIVLQSQAGVYGSLLRIGSTFEESLSLQRLTREMERSGAAETLFDQSALTKLQQVVVQMVALSQKNQITISNPPYLGSGGMNSQMATWIKDNYPDVKSDLFAAFIVRNTELTVSGGFLGFMSPFVWMFISSYEKLRAFLIDEKTITSLVQLEYSGFAGATVPICTFTLENLHRIDYKGGYVRLSDFKGPAVQGPKALEIITSVRSEMMRAALA